MMEALKGQTVRALGLKNPYAALMLNGKIETRTYPTKVRGWVLIYATKKEYSYKEVLIISGEKQRDRMPMFLLNTFSSNAHGHAIAIGKLVDCRPMVKEDEDKTFVSYHPALYCWVFEDVQPIQYIPFKGKQGWSILDENTISKITPLTT